MSLAPLPFRPQTVDEAFHYHQGVLHCEGVSAEDLAQRYGTPLYVYSQGAMLGRLHELQRGFAEAEPLICYSVKANSNLSLLRLMAESGSGFDVVSGGELMRVLEAGGDPSRTVFAGVGKTDEEIALGLRAGVAMFNVESEAELEAIARVANAHGQTAPITFRANPDVDPKTHQYITTGKKETKFGLEMDRVRALARRVKSLDQIDLVGVHMHIGSQIHEVEPFSHAVERGLALIADLRAEGHGIEWFNMGGGFGISYDGQASTPIAAFAEVIAPAVSQSGCRLALEPGRVIAGNAGILLSRLIYSKQAGTKRFLIQDAAMNDLIRPALYQAHHQIKAVRQISTPISNCDVVGPVCESGDFLAQDCALPEMEPGSLLAVFSAGAYAMVMASNYNTRPRAAEVLVNGDEVRLIRRRETFADLIAAERPEALN